MTNVDGEIEPIAIVGLSVRVPGARTPDEYWRNICAKVEAITWFESEELRAAGVPGGLLADPAYVRAACVLPDADMFDPEFFGISQAEAAMLDPQHRLFLECASEALEGAGHDPRRFDGAIGIYGGCFMTRYLINLYTNEAFTKSPMAYFARNYTDKDFLTGHVAYLLNLRGPAVTIQTACSTSLVATHMACQSLLTHDCDMALAGGVSVTVPLKAGYLAREGTMYTPEGRCRPFDASASGTLPGNGAVMVVLRRLSDALADGDHIHAIIRGTAVNNDGRSKVSFTAPNPAAQMQVIVAAQTVAGVHPDTIGYVEAHGTGTRLGDPIEVAALSDAFRYRSSRTNYCALGSVKANIGHLDAAAGAAGLVRAVLALERKRIPPQANFETPNPELKLDSSPFYVPTQALQWQANGSPRRAGVSSFAVGGTNAHVVLEEAPPRTPVAAPRRAHQLIIMSGRDGKAVDAVAEQLADHLEERHDERLDDVAFTLAVGRSELRTRRFVVADDRDAAVRALRDAAPAALAQAREPEVIFMFPGVGTQYPDMALDVYDAEPVFRQHVDACAELLRERLQMDVRQYLFGSRHPGFECDRESVPHALAAVFSVEYALAQLWLSWGIKPHALLGHSLGEYVAACLSGVLSLPDALSLTVRRGRIFDHIPDGRMLAVPLSEQELLPLLGDRLSLGAVNAPGLCLASGRLADLETLRASLAERGVQCRVLPVRMASHSQLVEPHLDAFVETVAEYRLAPPRIPFLSCVTGEWITSEQATSPAYWARQLRAPVQFGKMVREAASAPGRVLLEVGPGNTLTTLAGAQRLKPRPVAIACLRHPNDVARSDGECLLTAAGRLWQSGAALDWRGLLGSAARRVPLPTYPFQRKRYWIEQGRAVGPGSFEGAAPLREEARAEPAPKPVATNGSAQTLSEREQAVATIWRAYLGDEIDLDDDFESLGGHSLLAAQMLPALRALSPALMVKDIFGSPSVRRLAALIDAREAQGTVVRQPQLELTADVVLDPGIRAGRLVRPAEGPPSVVLLTGGTGFLGTFLLSELLRQTTASVHCLVRARDAAEGERRLRQALRDFELPAPQPGRLVAVPGDLQKPRLGLSGPDFETLAERVDAIYHCGAWVNFVRPYSVLRAANVGGTVEVLRLATKTRLKPVHYVSTLFVTMGSITTGVPFIGEDDPLPPPVNHDTPYTESKWVGEGICKIAAARDIPVAIYRPGNILGAQRTGVANAEDFFTKSIQGCVQLGLAPRRNWSLPIGTVDDVARMIVQLSLRSDFAGRTYQLVHPEKLEWNTIFDHLREFGYDLPNVSWTEWRAAFARQLAIRNDNALAPLADQIATAPENREWPRFGVENAAKVRQELQLPYPVLDHAYFAGLFRHFVARGLLPPPHSAGKRGDASAGEQAAAPSP